MYSILSNVREIKDRLARNFEEVINLYDERDRDHPGNELKVKECSSVFLIVEKMVRGNLLPQVSLDREEWFNIRATDMNTGTEFDFIHHPSELTVDVSAWNYFRLSLSLPFGSGSATVKAVILNEKAEEPVTKTTNYRPVPVRPESRIGRSEYSTRPTTEKSDGTWYGETGNAFQKSADYGDTWEAVYQVGHDRARQIKALDDGTLLLITKDGKVYKSNDNESNFEEVVSLISPDVAMGESIGTDVFENFAFIVEYGGKGGEDPPRRAFMSNDYGMTWEKIFEEEVRDDYHVHDIAFDPYEELIWIVSGDNLGNSNVVVSDDFGVNWRYIYSYGECPNQFTSILPMANCVLFTSDNRHDSVYRWKRSSQGINSFHRIILEPAFTIIRENPGSESFGTIGFVDHAGDGSAYFGYIQHHSNIRRKATVWATKDGINFYSIWTSAKFPESETGFVGITHVSGIDENGYLAVGLSGLGESALRLKKPKWEKI